MFPYRLLAFPAMMHFASLSTYDGSYPGSSHQDFTRHSYPFETLPMYNLSIQPHFIIYDTGMKLATTLHPCLALAKTLQANIECDGLGSRASFEAALLHKLHIPASFTDILEHLWICYSLYLRWMLSKPTPHFDQEPALSRAPSHSSARNRLPDSQVRPTTCSSAHAATLASSVELSTGTAGPTEEDGVLPMDSISCVTPFRRALVEGTDFEGRDDEENDTSIVDLEEDVEDAASFTLRIETWVKGALHADPPTDGGRLDDGMSDSTTLVGDLDSVKDGSRAKVAKDGQADTKGKYSVPRFQPSSTKVAVSRLTC
ncbi:hypothetical protein BDN71DRAFT_1435961 [Pleurotus eryngii]|uniref:Uncharacterized protein n=1 Tax=Pleurotus eryngii TaxID=5323 RepID=A0A9P5ZJR6_PLEER|nr:hypothetical protein BDN71DRAFT_1435961 [Pleurotus eryngii]